MRLKKLILLLSIIIVSIGVAGGIFMTYFMSSCTIRYQTLTSADGTQLASLVYRPLTPTVNLPGIVVAHGFMANKQLMQGISLELVKCGFVVIAIDFRGHGESSGNLGDERDIFGEAQNKLVDDVYAAIQYLRSLPYVDNNSIGLVGHSMGGAAVMATAIAFKDEVNATVSIGMVGSNETQFAINGTDINNLLIAIGALEEFISYDMAIEFLKNVTAQPSVTDGVIYGSFDNGTAAKLYVAPLADHILEITDCGIMNETCTWFRTSFNKGWFPPVWDNVRQLFIITAAFGSLLGFFVFVPYIKPVIFKNKPENSFKVKDPHSTKKILIYIGGYYLVSIIAFLLLLPLSALFSSSFNLIMSNFLIGLFWGFATGLLVVFYLIHRYVEKDPRPFFRRIKDQVSHNFNRTILFGLIVFLYSFGTLTAILHWSLFDLFPTVREWGATIVFAIIIFPYVFFDQLYIRNLQSYIPQGRIKELLKVVLLSTLAKIIPFIPLLFFNLGFAMIVIIILLIAYPFLELLATWTYLYSGRNLLSSTIYITLLFAWFLVASMPFGNSTYALI